MATHKNTFFMAYSQKVSSNPKNKNHRLIRKPQRLTPLHQPPEGHRLHQLPMPLAPGKRQAWGSVLNACVYQSFLQGILDGMNCQAEPSSSLT